MSILVVSNSSCIIHLNKIEHLCILEKLFLKVYIPEEVEDELYNSNHTIIIPRLSNVEVCEIENKKLFFELKQHIDPGESAAIVLAKEKNLPIIIDDQKARNYLSSQPNMRYFGTCRILVEAKKKNIISNVKSLLDMMISKGFRLGKDIYEKTLINAEES